VADAANEARRDGEELWMSSGGSNNGREGTRQWRRMRTLIKWGWFSREIIRHEGWLG
jgi:hypothetical protein